MSDPVNENDQPSDDSSDSPTRDTARPATRAKKKPVHKTPAGRAFTLGDQQPDDPRVQATADAAWDLYVIDRLTMKQVGAKLGICRETVGKLIKSEGAKRKELLAEARQAEIEKTLESYRDVEQYYRARMRSSQAKGDEGRLVVEAAKAAVALLGLAEADRITIEDQRPNPFAAMNAEQLCEMIRRIPDGGPFAPHDAT